MPAKQTHLPKAGMMPPPQLIHIHLEQTLLESVDTYRFSNRLRSRAAAIRLLLRSGLQLGKGKVAK